MEYALMRCPGLSELPPPPEGKTGWPWTEECPRLPEKQPDGSPWPRISLVTPTYNQGQFIEETIRSILLQGYPDIEYCIVDGLSRDGTVEVIRKYADHLAWWVSERDHGQTHAINKGLAHCTGQIWNWINSDDGLCPRSLQTVAEAWRTKPGALVAGKAYCYCSDGSVVDLVPVNLTRRNIIRFIGPEDERAWWPQSSTFLPLAEVKRIGGLQEELHYVMDRPLMIQLLATCPVVYVPEHLTRVYLHDACKSVQVGRHGFRLEFCRALKRRPDLRDEMTEREFWTIYVRTLVRCAEADGQQGRCGQLLKKLGEGLAIAPLTLISELRGRRAFLRFFRDMILRPHRA